MGPEREGLTNKQLKNQKFTMFEEIKEETNKLTRCFEWKENSNKICD